MTDDEKAKKYDQLVKAWDKVLKDIDGIKFREAVTWYEFYKTVVDIINKRLSEV